MLKILSVIYGLIQKLRYKLYDLNILKKRKADGVYIICIGNITAGGTGKTPAVQYFAKKIISEGKKVAIISRGYMGKRKQEPFIVSDGKSILCTPNESGDELYLHAISLKTPIVAAKKRYDGVKFCQKEFGSEVIIMDDGFQHIQLERDWNIVLIDATNPFGGNNLLPLGRLREPIAGLKRADEFIITRSDSVSEEVINEIIDKLKKYGKKISKAVHFSGSFIFKEKIINVEFIKGKEVFLFSGIGNPANFRRSIESLGAVVAEEVSYRDHYKFSEKDISEIERKFKKSNAKLMVTTEKDFVKIEKICSKEFIERLYILKIEFKISEENI
jgi:tetraacyldisaccharide 4'-kinase